jgi:AraC-like DNA-binding protein
MSCVDETKVLFRNHVKTPLGRLRLAGYIKNSPGVPAHAAPGSSAYSRKGSPAHPMRVLGSYVVVYLLEGSGFYRDANWYFQPVRAGDLILVFPELAHRYGPGPGEQWGEFYLEFDGPVFDLWHEVGLLDVTRPVHHLEPIDYWLGRFKAIAEAPRPVNLAGRIGEVYRFLGILTEFLASDSVEAVEMPDMWWLSRARSLLETHLNRDVDLAQIARQVGLSYASFRKRFQQHTGVSPARYRATRRIDAACELLQHTRMTSKEVAKSLGFSDEFYFSKRFKQITGMTPRAFRQRLPR